ncbi:MAG: alginate export family protein [Bryobacteraceae bacterium]|nr:alginate export family protein [Bryobacteraceae bacterium]
MLAPLGGLAGFDGDFFATRLRLGLRVRPVRGPQFFAEFQDSEAFALSGEAAHSAFGNTGDVHQLYAQWGGDDSGWRLRAGRQELPLGDERLLGADRDWCNVGRSFDAVALEHRTAAAAVTFLAGTSVRPRNARLDRFLSPDRVAGVHARFATAGGRLEAAPYTLFTLRRAEGELPTRSIATIGGQVQARLHPALTLAGELAHQAGRWGSLSASGWAGSWDVAYTAPWSDHAPTITGGFSYASPAGDRRASFDDLYPAGYNSAGLVDPFAWRNLKNAALSLEWPVVPRVRLALEQHFYWRASAADGVYVDDGLPIPLSGHETWLGSHANAALFFQVHEKIEGRAGWGWFVPGQLLRESGVPRRSRTLYVSLEYSL